jgi:hypothetical protein
VSISWEKAYQAYFGPSVTAKAASRWSTAFIMSLWGYTRQIWKNRNLQKHGTDEEQAMQTIMTQRPKS